MGQKICSKEIATDTTTPELWYFIKLRNINANTGSQVDVMSKEPNFFTSSRMFWLSCKLPKSVKSVKFHIYIMTELSSLEAQWVTFSFAKTKV